MRVRVRGVVIAVLFAALAIHLHAATPEAHRGSTVSFDSSPGKATAYLALPEGAGIHPAIIVIHEWWGLTDWIRDDADRFARNGYVALAVDLYRGKSTSDPAEAHELMRGLPEDRANADLTAAFEYLAKRPDVDPKRIGVIGWCMGGGYALSFAVSEPKLAAVVVNYGRLITDPSTIEKLKMPLMGNFGAKDRGITPADVEQFHRTLEKELIPHDIRIYDGAGHAFMNPSNQGGFRADDAKDAWERIDRFLERTLGG
ncbi:MAG: dienelactone hydrolase family protein [Thermoanaerobaculia bacterium]